MESKYQVVSIKENPFQRAGDVTFRGPSPSFTLPNFSLSFVPFFSLLFIILSVSPFLLPSCHILRQEKPSFPWGGFWIAALDQTLLKQRFREVLRTILWPFPVEPARQPSLMAVHSLEPGYAESREDGIQVPAHLPTVSSKRLRWIQKTLCG